MLVRTKNYINNYLFFCFILLYFKLMRYIILIVLELLTYISIAQYNSTLHKSEIKLKQLFDSLFFRNETRYLLTDSQKIALSDSISDELLNALRVENCFNFPFDSLKKLGKLTSSDSLLRIFSWNIRLKGGKNIFYAYIIYRNNVTDKSVKIYKLQDKTDSLIGEDIENLTLSYKHWFGATYYQVIPINEKKQKYYILIGWKGISSYINSKVVEVLFFNKKGKPLFGKNIFKSEHKTVKRLIFYHSLKAKMSCRYDKNINAIIFDHLVPVSNIYYGMYEFYGPNGTYDGYFKNKNIWIFKENVKPKNPPKKN